MTTMRVWPEGRNDCVMVNVAILGFGTVGSGVAEVLTGHEGSIERKVGGLIRLKYILEIGRAHV